MSYWPFQEAVVSTKLGELRASSEEVKWCGSRLTSRGRQFHKAGAEG